MLNGHWCAAKGTSGEIINRQRPVGSYTFSTIALLSGAPLLSNMQCLPTVSFICWPQTNEACLAKCNFRSHWLTTVVHELVNNPYIIQSFHFGLHGFGVLPLTSGTPFSLLHSETASLAFQVSHSSTMSKMPSLRISATYEMAVFDTSSTWAVA